MLYREDARGRLLSLALVVIGLAVINRWCG